MAKRPISPLADIREEIGRFIASNPRARHQDVRAFILQCVESHPRQAADLLCEFFKPQPPQPPQTDLQKIAAARETICKIHVAKCKKVNRDRDSDAVNYDEVVANKLLSIVVSHLCDIEQTYPQPFQV